MYKAYGKINVAVKIHTQFGFIEACVCYLQTTHPFGQAIIPLSYGYYVSIPRPLCSGLR